MSVFLSGPFGRICFYIMFFRMFVCFCLIISALANGRVSVFNRLLMLAVAQPRYVCNHAAVSCRV